MKVTQFNWAEIQKDYDNSGLTWEDLYIKYNLNPYLISIAKKQELFKSKNRKEALKNARKKGKFIHRVPSLKFKSALIGKTFGELEVLNCIDVKLKHTVWRCKCKCGKEITCSGRSLRNGKKINCGDKTKHISSTNYFKEIPIRFLKNIQKRARYDNLECNISMEYLWELFLKQNKKCALSDISLLFQNRTGDTLANASLDRIDSKIGYLKNNIQFVDKNINRMKQNFNQQDFINWCSLIYKKSVSNA
jgi:hypothetical protein